MMTRGRKRKPTKEISGITVPNPPKKATHVVLKTDCGNKATVRIKDFDTLLGTSGFFYYIQKNNGGKVVEKWNEWWRWSGKEVAWEFDM